METICHTEEEEDLYTKNLQKRYNGLVTARARAIRGKGAWYWSHLEPILLHNQQTGTPKALKLRCSLCCALFSASNPSRTSTEHLKRGTCPNFRNSRVNNANGAMSKIINHSQLTLPEKLPSLAMIPMEQTPCSRPTKPQLSERQIEIAINLFAEWFYESCGYVSPSTVNHPKFRAFLHQVGLPTVDERYIAGRRLDAKYAEAKFWFENKLQDAMFFQVSTSGWKKGKHCNNTSVDITLNLPNGNSLFHRILIPKSSTWSGEAMRDVLWSIVQEVSGYDVFRCAGIIADINDVNSKSLQGLELDHHWLINLTCQSYALCKLLRDLFKRLPLFVSTASLCHKIIKVIRSDHVNDRKTKLNFQENPYLGHTSADIMAVENVSLLSSKLGQSHNDKNGCSTPFEHEEIYTAIQDQKFWEGLDSVVHLTKSIKTLMQEIEEEKPCLGQCLLIWAEVKSKVKTWCTSFSIEEKPVMELVNKRFSKNYHQAWAASYILDPLYLVEDSCGRYLPPFKLLTSEQEKDVVKIITRLTQNEDAHIALMELMKWRTEGLDPAYAQAVQAKQRDPVTGKMRVMNPSGSRLVWETYLGEFKVLKKVAVRLVFLQATTGRLKWNHSVPSKVCSGDVVDRAHKLLFVSFHARLERGESTDDDGRDSEMLASENDETLDEILVDTSVC